MRNRIKNYIDYETWIITALYNSPLKALSSTAGWQRIQFGVGLSLEAPERVYLHFQAVEVGDDAVLPRESMN